MLSTGGGETRAFTIGNLQYRRTIGALIFALFIIAHASPGISAFIVMHFLDFLRPHKSSITLNMADTMDTRCSGTQKSVKDTVVLSSSGVME
jgi:hypothetical protein